MILRSPSAGHVRKGVSLLEVLISVSIFLIAIAALGQLIDMAGDRAEDVERRSLAMQVCRSKMNEVSAGATSDGGVYSLTDDFGDLLEGEDVPEGFREWQWEMTAEPLTDYAQNGQLVKVTVTVSWPSLRRERDQVSLTQIILNPEARGTTADAATIAGSDEAAATEMAEPTPAAGNGGN